MISVITTDAPIRPEMLHKALASAVQKSFNKITVTWTSTNDTCLLMASGKACETPIPFEEDSIAYAEFCEALDMVTQNLARMMARDGEGATKLVTVTVRGAKR